MDAKKSPKEVMMQMSNSLVTLGGHVSDLHKRTVVYDEVLFTMLGMIGDLAIATGCADDEMMARVIGGQALINEEATRELWKPAEGDVIDQTITAAANAAKKSR